MSRFDHAGGSVIFSREPRRPVPSLGLLQIQTETASGMPFCSDPVATEDLLPLQWRGMSTADLESLQDFFFQVVRGMAEPFSYTNDAGLVETVRFAKPQIDHEEIAAGRHLVTIQLLRG
ncbi:hypothetical protein [Desulfuromonas acetoxidans]|uniref:hypothetical protein n=1 Tax=Desulfuromonas acetoxidans TaxID=891 RepID=UPI00292F7D50|nr:hypothetical protein [Desulfuromonas acetoxidans]